MSRACVVSELSRGFLNRRRLTFSDRYKKDIKVLRAFPLLLLGSIGAGLTFFFRFKSLYLKKFFLGEQSVIRLGPCFKLNRMGGNSPYNIPFSIKHTVAPLPPSKLIARPSLLCSLAPRYQELERGKRALSRCPIFEEEPWIL